MKKLHKKIIAGALIGVISIGVGLSQGHKVFADPFEELKAPIHVEENEKEWGHSFLKSIAEHFNLKIEKLKDKPASNSIKKYYRNPGWFVEDLYDSGAKKGDSSIFWICGYYYRIEFRENIDIVNYWDRWENDKHPILRYGDYVYEKFFNKNNKDL